MFRDLGKIFLVGGVTWGLFFFAKAQTDGFSMGKIHGSSCDQQVSKGQDVRAVLDQPFFYLGRGAQSFAFVSEDGQTVIKFFSHHRGRHALGWARPLLPMKWRERLDRTLERRRSRLTRDFLSAKIAFDTLQEETGLKFIHLGRSDSLGIELTMYDKIGVRHRVNLDEMDFVVQERAQPTMEALEGWIERGEIDVAMGALSKLVELVRAREEMGIYDKNPDVRTNFGFVGARPIQFDVGRFSLQPERISPDGLVRTFDRLHCWLEKRSPKLAEHLEFEVHR